MAIANAGTVYLAAYGVATAAGPPYSAIVAAATTLLVAVPLLTWIGRQRCRGAAARRGIQ